MKNDHNYGYFADVSKPNWTDKVARSMNGEYSSPEKRIPPIAYAVALIAFVTLLLANFI